LRKNIPLLPSDFKRSLLHTELCGNCLTAAFDGESWHLTGMLDCADSFVGPAEYDFASVLLLLCKSDRTLRRAFFAGYGIEDQDLNGELENRIMTYTLLHRYCNLHWFMNVQPKPGLSPESCTSWDASKSVLF
jgi:hygromycin-B 7''-O-kinase